MSSKCYRGLKLVFILCILFICSGHAHARSGGGNEDDTTVSAALCSENPVTADTACHAWGLEWDLIKDPEGGVVGGGGVIEVVKEFDTFPEALSCTVTDEVTSGCVEGWRLPNIKELAKMFRYTPTKDDNGNYIAEIGNTALSHTSTRQWFNGKYFNGVTATSQVLSGANHNIEAGIEPYIISSTYRDLDMDSSNGDVQVLMMNLMTGAIMAFTRGGKFCTVAGANGTCSNAAHVITRDKDINPIFAFRVKTYVP